MLLEFNHVHLPIREDWFRQSLAETIVWCSGLPIEIDPHESPEVRDRRELGRKAGELNRRAHLSDWPELVKRVQYWRASRLFAKARLEDIAPLESQLRSSLLKPPDFAIGQHAEEHR